MKRILLVLMACFPVIGLMAAEVEPLAGDTIITLERKRIEVKDNGRLIFSKKGFADKTIEVEGQTDVSIQMAKGE